jgi:predicted CoA-binding protein
MTEQILQRSRTIAVVGLSTSPFKDAHRIPATMQQLGYRVIGVHPTAAELLGEPAYRRLADIDEHIDIVNVFRPADEAPGIAEQAVAVGADALWLQLGIRSAEAARIADAAGMDYVEDRCIAVDARMYGVRRSA